MQIDKAQFDVVKALAAIDETSSRIGAILSNLNKSTERYIENIGNEANKKVEQTLKESKEALEEVSKNHDELKQYDKDLNIYAERLNNFCTFLTKLSESLEKKIGKSEQDMKDHYSNISNLLKDVRIERIQIIEDRKQLEREKKKRDDEERLLKDRRATLERGFEELNRLKDKQQ